MLCFVSQNLMPFQARASNRYWISVNELSILLEQSEVLYILNEC